jgi:ABC-type transporter Mla subunit MlaD
MPRSLRWSQLLPGIAAFTVLVTTVLCILLFAQVGAAKGDTMRLYTSVESARGIMKGSEVWLHGKPIGVVQAVGFAPPSTPVERRLVVALDVVERYRPFIRRDSDAQVRAGGSLIGAPVIYLTGGSPSARVVGVGDTIAGRPQIDLEGITTEFSAATKELPVIMQNLQMIATQLRATTGTIGAFTAGEGGVELEALQARSSRIAGSLRGGRGTLGLALGGREALAARGRTALASVDSLRQLLASGRGELGRFRRDSTLIRAVSGVRDELSIVRALLEEPRGTAGRMTRDRAIQLELARADTSMQLLMQDIKQRPLRYLQLF